MTRSAAPWREDDAAQRLREVPAVRKLLNTLIVAMLLAAGLSLVGWPARSTSLGPSGNSRFRRRPRYSNAPRFVGRLPRPPSAYRGLEAARAG